MEPIELLFQTLVNSESRNRFMSQLRDDTKRIVRATVFNSQYVNERTFYTLTIPTEDELTATAKYFHEQHPLIQRLLNEAECIWRASDPYTDKRTEQISRCIYDALKANGLELKLNECDLVAAMFSEIEILDRLADDDLDAYQQALIAVFQFIRWVIYE